MDFTTWDPKIAELESGGGSGGGGGDSDFSTATVTFINSGGSNVSEYSVSVLIIENGAIQSKVIYVSPDSNVDVIVPVYAEATRMAYLGYIHDVDTSAEVTVTGGVTIDTTIGYLLVTSDGTFTAKGVRID